MRDFLQILELYEDFHITQLPLLQHEVRGGSSLEQFSTHLLGDAGGEEAMD